MAEKELQRQVDEGYQVINNKWMRFHQQLLILCTLLTVVIEILMFFVIHSLGSLSHSPGEYWVKYIIVPAVLNLCIAASGCCIIRNQKLSILLKQYGISFSFVLLAYVLSFMHSGFVAVLVTAIFPILMTIMYENEKLTAIIGISSGILQFVSGYFIFWDKDKKLDEAYIINLMVLLVATFCTWLTCYFMIKFMKLKREIIINNDMERYQLQKKVNIDGLTNIGNKLALMNRFEKIEAESNRHYYLVMLDIDDFKLINDTYGHIVGDEVLKCLAKGMQDIKCNGEAYRYGGDEFCIVFAEKFIDAIVQEVERVQNYLQCHMKIVDERVNPFVSAGVACYSKEETWIKALQQADGALYESKKQHGNRITVYKNKNTF